jgi:hypothetical protein
VPLRYFDGALVKTAAAAGRASGGDSGSSPEAEIVSEEDSVTSKGDKEKKRSSDKRRVRFSDRESGFSGGRVSTFFGMSDDLPRGNRGFGWSDVVRDFRNAKQ